MKKSIFFVIVLLLSLSIAAFFGCSKSDGLQGPTGLEITIKDVSGNVLPGANVKLYLSETDMLGSSNQVGTTQIANSAGKVIFSDLSPVQYYWYASIGSKNNSNGIFTTPSPLSAHIQNAVTTILFCEGFSGIVHFINSTTDDYDIEFQPAIGVVNNLFTINAGTTQTVAYDPPLAVDYTIHATNLSTMFDSHFLISSVCEGRDTLQLQ